MNTRIKDTNSRPKARFQFIGISTTGSSVFDLFPLWAESLGLDAEMQGVDIPSEATPDRLRAAVKTIRDDNNIAGALITSHKVNIFQHARDVLDGVDLHAETCQEISCIAKHNGQLYGYAKDPVVARRALQDILNGDDEQPPIKSVLCLGAGGAGTAITVALAGLDLGLDSVTVTDVNERRLTDVAAIHAGALGLEGLFRYMPVSSPTDTDNLLLTAQAPVLVINATGLGKDRPGSPISDDAIFPPGSIVWELNYRGDLGFLHQAAAQASAANLRLHDGWQYFLRAWAMHIEEIFSVDVGDPISGTFAKVAKGHRPQPPAGAAIQRD